MRQLTIRITDSELEHRLESLARSEGKSLNQAALQLLRKGAGIEPDRTSRGIRGGLDAFFGTMSEEEVREMNEAVAIFESVDETFWR